MVVNTSGLPPGFPPKEKVTFEEFLAWCDEDSWAEWVDGEVVMVSPASIRHQEIGSFLETLLSLNVEAHKLGRIIRAPFVMRLPEGSAAREPDLLFVKQEHVHLIGRSYLDGAADLVVETVSPESIGRDRGDKFVEYERAAIKEYWLIDPERQCAEFYELANDGRYHLASLSEYGIYRSKVVSGFWLRVDWLWQTPPPPALEILREMKIIS
jgi:Uma2 family endonuclease